MSPQSDRRAVVLLSGGLDSATAAAITQREGFELYALTLRYGQRHAAELACARQVAEAVGAVRHIIAPIDLRAFGGSALTDDIDVPKGRDLASIGDDVPITYVPARNTIFLSFALGWAEVVGARDIVIGANALDYSGYPDCRPDFLHAFETVANLGTRAGREGKAPFRIRAPLLTLTKAEIIQRGLTLGLDYSLTLSCYDPDDDGRACGQCDACLLRLKGFRETGVTDPARYQTVSRR
ncbi:MAG TPA: 7-cyano-7-deazaguanine synthase QueC [Gemmatimonadales bacterium]|nr:7-cyano-7-deazaguanine synthase QueC [Gemmatimonadales bacterium]